jgi:hypothetical protein
MLKLARQHAVDRVDSICFATPEMAMALRTGDRLAGTQQTGPRYQTGVNVIAQLELQPVTAAEIPGGGDTGGKHLPRTLAHGDLIRQIIRSRGRFLLRIEHHVNVGVN